jgi:protein-L-isoaspartate(D-aspartate) O-methyltransferase
MELARQLMVEEQIAARGVKDPRVLEAMRQVPRHEFVPFNWRAMAYVDRPLPIGYEQTISQPYIVAFMTEQLKLTSAETVLEIGTGSGYQAAILARLAAQVYSVEIVAPLAEAARGTLQRLGCWNVHIKTGDGSEGWPEHAPYNSIIVTCAPEDIPQALVRQLKEGGRMMIPLGKALHQELILLEKREGVIHQKAVLPVLFVPMTGRGLRPDRQ